MPNVIYKLVHFHLFDGYEILGEFDTEEAAEARKAELLERAPEEILVVAHVPRCADGAEREGE